MITRPKDDAPRTAALLAARGWTPVTAPVLEVRMLHPAIPCDVQAVVVTSGNALASIAPWPVPVLAVGDVTASRARAHGFGTVHSASGDAAALSDLARRLLDPAGSPVLVLTGAGQGAALIRSLRDGGFRILRRQTYVTGPAPVFPHAGLAALQSGRVHAALFLSTDTVRAFVNLLPAAAARHVGDVLALAIGQGAADALKPLS